MKIFTMSEIADRAALEVLEIFNWLPLSKYLDFHDDVDSSDLPIVQLVMGFKPSINQKKTK